MIKKYLILFIIIIVIISVFLIFNSSFKNKENISNKISIELNRLNYCDSNTDCLIDCSNIIKTCGGLYFYNKNEDLSYFYKLIDNYSKINKSYLNINCLADICHEFYQNSYSDINISCVNNKCVSDSNNAYLFIN